jgi:biotin-(acetyl-CoA carboxylase) ligase
VNLAQRCFPAALEGRATSVALVTGTAVDREVLLAALLDTLGRGRAALERGALGEVLERWRTLSATLGRPVAVDGVHGVAVDIDEDGALLVADGAGRHRVVAGELR